MFSGRVVVEHAAGARDRDEFLKYFRNPRNDLPRVTHDTSFDIPHDFGTFRTYRSVPRFCFSKLPSRRKKLILQAVGLTYKYWEMN